MSARKTPVIQAIKHLKRLDDVLNRWLSLQENDFDPVKLCNKIRERLNNEVYPIADYLDRAAVGTGGTKIGGGAIGIVGGGLTIAGLCAVPFSLPLLFAGLGVGIGGAVISGTGITTRFVLDKTKGKKSEQTLKSIQEDIVLLATQLEDDCKKIREAIDYLMSEDGQREFKNSADIAAATVSGVSSAMTITGSTVFRLIRIADFAAEASADVISVGGRTALTVGSKAAIVVSSIGAVLSIGFGVWDCVSGGLDIKNKNKLAIKIREEVDKMETNLKDIENNFKQLRMALRVEEKKNNMY